jgi:hypothetical protein
MQTTTAHILPGQYVGDPSVAVILSYNAIRNTGGYPVAAYGATATSMVRRLKRKEGHLVNAWRCLALYKVPFLTRLLRWPLGPLRYALAHMVEETARHCGHLDLLRESIDGQTGE